MLDVPVLEVPLPVVPRDLAPELRAVSDTLSEVILLGERVGFIEVTGPVFVTLVGERCDRAVEVAQSLVLDHAVARLVPWTQAGRVSRRDEPNPLY